MEIHIDIQSPHAHFPCFAAPQSAKFEVPFSMPKSPFLNPRPYIYVYIYIYTITRQVCDRRPIGLRGRIVPTAILSLQAGDRLMVRGVVVDVMCNVAQFPGDPVQLFFWRRQLKSCMNAPCPLLLDQLPVQNLLGDWMHTVDSGSQYCAMRMKTREPSNSNQLPPVYEHVWCNLADFLMPVSIGHYTGVSQYIAGEIYGLLIHSRAYVRNAQTENALIKLSLETMFGKLSSWLQEPTQKVYGVHFSTITPHMILGAGGLKRPCLDCKSDGKPLLVAVRLR